MSAKDGRLDDATHARVFANQIIPESRLDHATAQESPRAIAAHRLESELGVDRHFTNQLEREGYGHPRHEYD